MTAIAPSPIFTETPDPRGLGGLMTLVGRAERPLPLKEVKVRASMIGPFCRTVVEQRFTNAHDVSLEAVHIFPLPVDGIVTEVELRAGEVVVRAECQERKEAEATFAAAREAGHRAALLTAERADVHTLRVTNLPPQTEVVVRIVVVEQLEAIDGKFRWRFPTVIAPRYMPGTATGHDGPGTAKDTDVVPDASRISPPLRLSGGTRLDLQVELTGPIRSLESSLHAIQMEMDGGGVTIAPAANATLNKDFILAFSTAAAQEPSSRAWTDGRYTALLVEAPAEAQMPAVGRDAVFVVDISGSMGGIKMDAAKRALSAALHGLMPGDRFRLVAFDDRVENFRPDFVNYDDQSLKAADQWIARLSARGGTEMLPALHAAFAGQTPSNRLRTVLFVTDGQAGDENRLAAAVANKRNGARLFTLGIDTAVNAALLKQLARLGGGTCELCTPTDDIEAVVVKLEARFGSPLVQGLVVEAGVAARPDPEVLFSGRPVAMMIEGAPAKLNLRGLLSSGGWQKEVVTNWVEAPLGALWARQRIRYLEDRLAVRPFEEEAIKPEILRISLEHKVVSQFTAMVAVDRSVQAGNTRIEVVQPVELPASWDASFGGGGAPPPPLSAPPRPGGIGRAVVASPAPAAPPMPPTFSAPASRSSAPVPMSVPVESAEMGPDTNEESVYPTMDAMPMESSRRRSAKMAAPKAAKSTSLLGRAVDALSSVFKPSPVVADEDDGTLYAEKEEAPMRNEAAAEKKKASPIDESGLARSQGADGSFGADIGRTAAALVLLVLLGHTRRKGLRSRTVTKAAAFLQAHPADPRAALALSVLEAAEAGTAVTPTADWDSLFSAGPEGAALQMAAHP